MPRQAAQAAALPFPKHQKRCCMKNLPALLLLIALALLGHSCIPEKVEIPEQTIGLAPVYHEGDWKAIASEPPQSIRRLFKIYYKDNYIFAGESQQGIHVIDNTDPANPQPLHFIRIIGNSDIAIRGNVLYANNLTDLVVIDISNLNDIRLLSRLEGVFPQLAGAPIPLQYVGFFECPDEAMGTIVGWTEQLLKKPECWR
jgi:hypothetical protein